MVAQGPHRLLPSACPIDFEVLASRPQGSLLPRALQSSGAASCEAETGAGAGFCLRALMARDGDERVSVPTLVQDSLGDGFSKLLAFLQQRKMQALRATFLLWHMLILGALGSTNILSEVPCCPSDPGSPVPRDLSRRQDVKAGPRERREGFHRSLTALRARRKQALLRRVFALWSCPSDPGSPVPRVLSRRHDVKDGPRERREGFHRSLTALRARRSQALFRRVFALWSCACSLGCGSGAANRARDLPGRP